MRARGRANRPGEPRLAAREAGPAIRVAKPCGYGRLHWRGLDQGDGEEIPAEFIVTSYALHGAGR